MAAYPFTLGAVSECFVETYDGFNRPSKAVLVDLLSDGTSANDQVLQQGSLPFRQALLGGWLYSASDVDLLRAYNDTKETVAFTDADGGTFDVVVLDCSVKAFGGLWSYQLTLLDATITGS